MLLGAHPGKTVHRGVQVTRKIVGCLGAHAESGARVFFDCQQSGERRFFEMLDEIGDSGIKLSSWNHVAHQPEGERLRRVTLLC